jgi:hypothetical protein
MPINTFLSDLTGQRLENFESLCTLNEYIFYVCFVKSITHKIKEHFTIKSFKVLISNAPFFVGPLRAPVNLVRRNRKRILHMELGVLFSIGRQSAPYLT